MMNIGGIYEILNTVNGKRYIGSTVNFVKRWSEHRCALRRGDHHNAKLQNAWNKHGGVAFQFNIVMLGLTGSIRDTEQQYLDFFKPEYNIATNVENPSVGRVVSPETREKQGAAWRGKKRGPFSAEHRAKLSEAKQNAPQEEKDARVARMLGNTLCVGKQNSLGLKHTPEAKAKVSKSMLQRPRALIEQIAKKNTGKTRSKETCAAISKSNTGKIRSPEFCEAMSIARTGKKRGPHSPETIDKMRIAARLRWDREKAGASMESERG